VLTEGRTMAVKTRKGRPRRAGLDAEVLAATVDLVAADGYAGTTLDDVAGAVGAAKTTLYRRWPSKGELAVDALATVLGTPPTDLPPGPDGLRAAIDWLVAGVRGGGVQRLLLGVVTEAADNPKLRAGLRTRMRDPFTRRLASDWDLPRKDVDLAFDVVVGTLLHRLAMTGRITTADAKAVSEVAGHLLFGTDSMS
jgi:AcrR family transcriptional regulator